MPRSEELDLTDAGAVADVLHAAGEALRESKLRRGASVHLPNTGRVTVTGDLHDHGPNLRRILKVADLDASKKNHLILHEVIHGENFLNGADLSVRTLIRVAELKVRYPEQVHLMQSNHELAQYHGEGISKGDVGVVEAFDFGVADLYGDDAEAVEEGVRDYVRSLPLCVRTAPPKGEDRGLFIAHSLPAPKMIESFDRAMLDRELTDEELAPRGDAYEMVWGRYHNATVLNEWAEAWKVSVFILGHQPAAMGYELVGDNGLIIASDHHMGVAVPLDLSVAWTRDAVVDAVLPLNEVSVAG